MDKPASVYAKILKRIWALLPALFLAVLVAVIAGLGMQIKAESERLKAEKLKNMQFERPPVNVVVLDLKPTIVRDKIELPAVVGPWTTLGLLAEVGGAVMEVPVKEGDYLKKGDVIARIDERDYRNAMVSAQAAYDLALTTRERMERLYSRDLVSKAEYDKAAADAEMLGAALKNAKLRLERCAIRAPMDGVINRLDAKVGLLLAVSDPVATVLDISRVKVSVGIPESDVDAVRKLEEFDVVIDALGGKVFRGKKVFLARAPESRAQLYRLEIGLDNPEEEILPGMFTKARIVKKKVEEGITVPLYAVISKDNERFVFVENGGTAHARPVELGIMEGWLTQVTRGLEPGDGVVVVGHRSLEEGQTVNVVRTVSDPQELFR